jgi:tRNA ligase
VLAYAPEETGLHLHGLNANTKEFKTMLPDAVDAFAREWGFIVTKSTVLQSIPEVKEFTDGINAAKEWNGRALEGFVVRTHVAEPPATGNTRSEQSPYAPGSSYFFKVKFDEPYMMYRDWREVTKMLLTRAAKGDRLDAGALPKKRMGRAETRVYVDWVIAEIKRDVKQFDGYQDNHGIVATRERFLKWLTENKDKAGVAEVPSVPGATTNTTTGKGADADAEPVKLGKTIIMPVAIPGCGAPPAPTSTLTSHTLTRAQARRPSPSRSRTSSASATRSRTT